jgi:hypothetical protein
LAIVTSDLSHSLNITYNVFCDDWNPQSKMLKTIGLLRSPQPPVIAAAKNKSYFSAASASAGCSRTAGLLQPSGSGTIQQLASGGHCLGRQQVISAASAASTVKDKTSVTSSMVGIKRPLSASLPPHLATRSAAGSATLPASSGAARKMTTTAHTAVGSARVIGYLQLNQTLPAGGSASSSTDPLRIVPPVKSMLHPICTGGTPSTNRSSDSTRKYNDVPVTTSVTAATSVGVQERCALTSSSVGGKNVPKALSNIHHQCLTGNRSKGDYAQNSPLSAKGISGCCRIPAAAVVTNQSYNVGPSSCGSAANAAVMTGRSAASISSCGGYAGRVKGSPVGFRLKPSSATGFSGHNERESGSSVKNSPQPPVALERAGKSKRSGSVSRLRDEIHGPLSSSAPLAAAASQREAAISGDINFLLSASREKLLEAVRKQQYRQH